MSSPRTRIEFLEGFLDLRLPQQSYIRWRWHRALMAVCFVVLVFGSVGMIVSAESLRETLFPAAQIIFWTFMACSFAGQEIAFDTDAEDRTPGFGRKLRVVGTIAVIAFFPLLLAAAIGNISLLRGSYWLLGVLIGGAWGLRR